MKRTASVLRAVLIFILWLEVSLLAGCTPQMPVSLQLEVNEVLTKIEMENQKDAGNVDAEYVGPGSAADTATLTAAHLRDLDALTKRLAAGGITLDEFDRLAAADREQRDNLIESKKANRYAVTNNIRESGKAAAMLREKLQEYAKRVNGETTEEAK